MPNVRVTCLLCDHPVEVPASAVVLHLAGTDADADNRYGFTCPDCAVYVVRRANDAIVDALVRTDGVEVAMGARPPWESGDRPGIVLMDAERHGGRGAERLVTDRIPRRTAAPITEADVLLFREALADDAVLAAWLS